MRINAAEGAGWTKKSHDWMKPMRFSKRGEKFKRQPMNLVLKARRFVGQKGMVWRDMVLNVK